MCLIITYFNRNITPENSFLIDSELSLFYCKYNMIKFKDIFIHILFSHSSDILIWLIYQIIIRTD